MQPAQRANTHRMIRIAVCDDDSEDLRRMKESIQAVEHKISMDAPVEYFNCGEDLIASIRRGQEYSFTILDIYMTGMTGIDTAKVVRELLPDVYVGFLTSSEEFALDAYDLNAVHYMMKPATPEKVDEMFQRYLERARIPARVIEMETDAKTHSFPLHLMEKVQSATKGVDVYIKNVEEPYHLNMSFMRAEEQLEGCSFLRISRGLLINIDYVETIDNDICRMKDGTEYLISRREKAAIRKQYNDYLFAKIYSEGD